MGCKVAKAIGRVHAAAVLEKSRPFVENERFRRYLIAYPFAFLEPYLADDLARTVWDRFLVRNNSAERHLIHGDLKPGNICVVDRTVWLIDFERSNLANLAYDLGSILCRDRSMGPCSLEFALTN